MESAEFGNMESYVTKRLIEDKITTADLARELQSLFPEQSGFSVSSINRYCQAHNIRRRGTVSDEALLGHVRTAIVEVRESQFYNLSSLNLCSIH